MDTARSAWGKYKNSMKIRLDIQNTKKYIVIQDGD